MEIGERILFKELNDQQQLGGWDRRWSEGIWIGYDLTTHQAIIASAGRAIKANTVRRVPFERRWDAGEIDAIRVKPWQSQTERAKAERTIGPRREKQTKEAKDIPEMTEKELGEKGPHGGTRDFRIRKEDVLEHDPTPGCPGCTHAVGPEGGVRTGGHHAQCRKRFAEIFSSDPAKKVQVEAAKARKRVERHSEPEEAEASEEKRARIENTELAAEKRARSHENMEARP